MTRIKTITIPVLVLCFILSAFPQTVSAQYVRFTRNTYALVLQVIDGDALRVLPVGTASEALVKLAGVDSMGRSDAFEYMNGALLGRTVYISLDNASAYYSQDRWVHAYVTLDNVNYNRELVRRGFARVDSSYSAFTMYNTLLVNENSARYQKLGMWALPVFTVSSPSYVSGRDRLNINTASSSQINAFFDDYFGDFELNIGSAIVNFRNKSPFRSVSDLKFVNILTREEFELCRDYLTVATNINTASQAELQQLTNVTASIARAVIDYRDQYGFIYIDELVGEKLMTQSVYDRNENFITENDIEIITAAIPDVIVDVNTADEKELQSAGLTAQQALAAVNARGNGYTIKNVGELMKITGISLSESQINELADNIRAGDPENWGYDEHYEYTLININTASREELSGIGFTETQISRIISNQRRMRGGKDIPFDVTDFDKYITLYTNANTASAEEWMSLSSQMPYAFASVLADAANKQPFGSMAELSEFFEDYGYYDIYSRISAYIVLR